ncbi:MAG: glycosyltransferase [Methanosphaera stadtmanae]|nr:glycosyltransferase [Methanosphaera stadtmanae]
MVKVSIIMPVYNASKYVEQSVISVNNQSLKDIELICINDGSTDNSLELLNNLKEKYDFIKIFTQENQGSGQARNYGISEASGEYIAFLDADDIFIDDDALEKMYFYGHKNNANMVGSNLKRINLDGSLDKYYDYENTDFKYFDKKDVILPVEYGIPFAFYRNIFKKEFIDENNFKFPNLKRGQDPIFLANILTNLDEIYVLNCDLYGYNNKVAGGVNVKVNTYEKKYDYIMHFKDTLDILKNNEFDNAFEGYKKEFVKYLIFENNLKDPDIRKIVPEIFENINEYYNENDYGYNYISIIYNNQNLDEINNELNNFRLIKQSLFEETLINDNFIDLEYLQEYVSISKNNQKNKNELEVLSFEALKNVEKNVYEDNKYLTDNIDNITEEINQIDNSNNAILSSNSWKSTEFLRTMKHFYKK